MPTDSTLPIATATVAMLYMEQGKLDQAEQIYRHLLRDSPDDPRLVAGLQEVQRRREGQPHGAGSDDMVALQVASGRQLICSWRVTAGGRTRARLVLGDDGALVLRVVAFPSGPKSPPVDVELAETAGEASVTAPGGASLVGAAVGLRGKAGEFVSITHCAPIPLDR